MADDERTVPEDLGGSRLDKAVQALFGLDSRAQTRKLIEDGRVRKNGRRAPKGALVDAGDVLRIEGEAVSDAGSACVASPEAPLDVVFESDLVVIVDKPAGMSTAPLRAGETGTLANALLGRHPELAGVGYSAREPGLLHRLDRGTSGLVIAARTGDAFVELTRALKEGAIAKRYLVVCTEEGLPDEGSIEIGLANHPKDQRRVLACLHPRDVMRLAPRAATTRYRVDRRANGLALVSVWAPKALRHQIRAHFAAIDHPLLGDDLYGGPPLPAACARVGHALHACQVTHEHSDPQLSFDVTSPLPADLAALVA